MIIILTSIYIRHKIAMWSWENDLKSTMTTWLRHPRIISVLVFDFFPSWNATLCLTDSQKTKLRRFFQCVKYYSLVASGVKWNGDRGWSHAHEGASSTLEWQILYIFRCQREANANVIRNFAGVRAFNATSSFILEYGGPGGWFSKQTEARKAFYDPKIRSKMGILRSHFIEK